jgi:hypothetical protein
VTKEERYGVRESQSGQGRFPTTVVIGAANLGSLAVEANASARSPDLTKVVRTGSWGQSEGVEPCEEGVKNASRKSGVAALYSGCLMEIFRGNSCPDTSKPLRHSGSLGSAASLVPETLSESYTEFFPGWEISQTLYKLEWVRFASTGYSGTRGTRTQQQSNLSCSAHPVNTLNINWRHAVSAAPSLRKQMPGPCGFWGGIGLKCFSSHGKSGSHP